MYAQRKPSLSVSVLRFDIAVTEEDGVKEELESARTLIYTCAARAGIWRLM